ncbi:MAG TPA: hypothetical protein H9902_08635 [Candidatus Stackebrandtia faecavium]|nr:hypothetical protein [Candidatus Stackebrandtia faecavium]
MRWMLIMQASPETVSAPMDEADMAQTIADMGAYNENLIKAGVFAYAEGLAEQEEGFKVDFESEAPVVTDGPFTEAKEVFMGFWILDVASREEAMMWAKKCPLGPGTTLEVRRVHEIDDFGEVADDPRAKEWLDKEKQWRAAQE